VVVTSAHCGQIIAILIAILLLIDLFLLFFILYCTSLS
jgi:hypothetical protein